MTKLEAGSSVLMNVNRHHCRFASQAAKKAYHAARREKGLEIELIEGLENTHLTLVNKLADAESGMFKRLMAMLPHKADPVGNLGGRCH